MAAMTSSSNTYSSTYRSSYRSDYLAHISRTYSNNALGRTSTDSYVKNDLPSVHSRFQTPANRDVESASAGRVALLNSRPEPRSLPPRLKYIPASNVTVTSLSNKYTTASRVRPANENVGYAASHYPIRAENTDAYKRSERNYSAVNKTSQVPSVHLTSIPDGSTAKTSSLGATRRDYQTSFNADVEAKPITSVRRRSASLGAVARSPLGSTEQKLQKDATSTKETADDPTKEKLYGASRTVRVVTTENMSNSNDSKSDSLKSSSGVGHILGGTASDDYRNRGNGQQLSTSPAEVRRNMLSNNDSSNDLMLSGARLADKGATGLDNLGNTCFMNSILQCLSNTRPLLEYCLSGTYTSDVNKKTSQMNGHMIKAYAQLMRSMWDSGKATSVAPTEFKSQVSRFARQFVGYSQHDAHEFLIYLLEGLHEEVNRIQEKKKRFIDCSNEVETISASEKAKLSWQRYLDCDNSKIIDIFAGQLKSALTCNECGYVSNTFDPFLALSLPIKKSRSWSGSESVTLTECFDLFTQEETLSGDDRPMCAKCRCRRTCTKRFLIQRFPRVLVIHLKRFNQGSSYSKLRTEVSCPPSSLDLTKYSADSGAQPLVYNMYAVSNHNGTMFSGHYTAYAKNPYCAQWYSFNDARVSQMKVPRLTSDAYLLFYELQD